MTTLRTPRYCPFCGALLGADDVTAGRCGTCGVALRRLPGRTSSPGHIDVRRVARCQRRLINCVGLMFAAFGLAALANGIAPSGARIAVLLGFGCWIAGIVLALELLAACGVPLSVRIAATMLLLFTPCMGVVGLVGVSMYATRVLRRAGIPVGLHGARDADVQRHVSYLHCHVCGYLLIGNVSGICPECGTPVAEPSQS